MFLSDESAFYKCPDRLRLPLIFYFGHTAAVYVNKLVLGGLLKVYLFLKTHMYVYTVLVLVMQLEEDVHPKCNNKIVLFFIQINMLAS